MLTKFTITGMNTVIANMAQSQKNIGEGVSRGLRLAGLALQRESQMVVPVDFGPLKASAYTRAQGKGIDTVVTVGYTAAYALYVHEQVGMKMKGQPRTAPSKGNYWDPAGRGQAKFLEEPMRRLMPRLADIIKKEIKANGIDATVS